jgi:lysophospholipase L1-like esterase
MADSPSSPSTLPDTEPGPTPVEQMPAPPPLSRLKWRSFLYPVLIVSLALNVAGTAMFAARVMRKGGVRYLLERLDLRDAEHPTLPFQADWRAQFRKLPNTKDEIVFAGDSLIADGPWAELFSPIKNRGIGGETTAGLLDRLDEVTEGQPRKVFLQIGTNCLAADIPVAQIVRNYRAILGRIRRESPEAQVFVISVLPVNQRFAQGPVHDNASIRLLNHQLHDLVGQFEGVAFLDVFDALTDASGDLRKDLTIDGLHLNIDGYLVLGRLLADHVIDRAQREGEYDRR